MSIVAQQSKAAFEQIFHDVATKGKICSPRGQKVLELENYTYELPPYVRFQNFESRKLKLNYIKEEFLWYLNADPKDQSITEHASLWKSLVNLDNTINSNYGQYVFATAEDGYGFGITASQLDKAVFALANDKDTRRASVMILNAKHLFMQTNDVPCTYSLNFRIRENKLNMSVHMRSQDGVFGMGNDAPTFSFIQEIVFTILLAKYENLEMGSYHHIADSFHVYERHFELLEKIGFGKDAYIPVDVPRIKDADEVAFLVDELKFAHNNMAIYKATLHPRDPKIANLIKSGARTKATNYDFSSWLLNRS